jgi:hypothetical protein
VNAPRFQAGIEGVDELVLDLNDCGVNTKKTHKGAIRAGTKVIRAAAEARAAAISSRPGRKTKISVRARKDYIVGNVFPNKGFAFLRPVEKGTSSGWRWARTKGPFKFYAGKRLIVTRLIKHPGTAKRPWLKPAFESSMSEATQAVGDAFKAAIEQAHILAEGNDS